MEYLHNAARYYKQAIRVGNYLQPYIPKENQNMDLTRHVTDSEWRDYITSDDVGPDATEWRIDDVRPPLVGKKTATVCYVDLAKRHDAKDPAVLRCMPLREGKTLDAFARLLGKDTDKWKGKRIFLIAGGRKGEYVNLYPNGGVK